MSRAQRDKGRKGEREVAELYERRGFTVRGLEGAGDHLLVCDPDRGELLHSEVKRQEVARPWQWWEQASSEAPAGAMPVVHFRRNRSPWLALLAAEELARLLSELRDSRRQVFELRRELDELRSDA